ncbi:MAG TPA: aldehyde dehydrogenase family protein [Caulobacteraceae bacterium]|jgi:aldehyde dehydrogenase (NAD+)|nr:aldehyde dehydrogenase family protein [Caulobacteraceae bacterium]
MRECLQFYIGGQWVEPVEAKLATVVNPATEQPSGRVALGSAADVDRAVAAAKAAFPAWSRTSRQERIALLERIADAYRRRIEDLAEAITEEMGAPTWLAQGAQAPLGLNHLLSAIEILKTYSFEEDRGPHRIAKEPIGVCGFITPWNWPIHQIAAKVAPALAVGCTMVLKPSEIAPFSARIFAEILDAAGVPAGVFNMVQGEGPVVGAGLAAHRDVDMVSITGSTRAGADVARTAAPTIKRVLQELGGKSPNIILEDADLTAAVANGVNAVMNNSGQSCRAPTRMLVPNRLMDRVVAIARETAEGWTVGDPTGNSRMGPVVSKVQWDKVQALIEKGSAEGATLVTGGPGRPEGLDAGWFVRPTVFAGVSNDMAIAREEIFGPVLSILGYDSEEEAIAIANDTDYGLGGYVQSGDIDHARAVASRIRAGYISLNNAGLDLAVPFGGYKRSGNGREFADHGFGEFLEVKSILGFNP